ncbi:MAG: SGNH/GDSL hydrolase family protein, partial [Ruminococcus sp.]|nr:SGNH/GDSL hydrolase family protein [Ruminococcus sp.]
GIIDSYTEEEYFAFVSRRYAANTMVRALGYGKRSIEHVTDLGSTDSALMTLAYYGYFIPDSSDKLYPERVLSASEFDSLISELHLYKALKGKKVVSFGDSIMYGVGNDNRSMSGMVAEKYGMHVSDYSYPGAVMGEYTGKSHIPTQVRHAIAASSKPDIILINGGTNDSFRTALGKMTDGYDMSAITETSFTNGFEKAMYLIRSEWGNVPVIYVRAHNMLLGADKDERAFGERGLAVAEKWNAAGIDLYNNSGMNAENAKIRDRYTWYDPDKGYHDTIHPTALGYSEFYLPAIGEVLAATFGE